MTSELIKPWPLKNKLPRRGFLAATGLELKALSQAAPTGCQKQGPLLGGLTTLTVWPGAFLAGPFLGAPMAAMVLETLIKSGAEEIIFMGLAGSLVSSLKPGDIFMPNGALSTEGTSGHYPAPLKPDEKLFMPLTKILPAAQGLIWSTDAVYRETPELIARQSRAGAQAVDMECAALMAVASFRGAALAAVTVISDQIGPDGWQPGFKDPAFKNSLAQTATKLWNFIS